MDLASQNAWTLGAAMYFAAQDAALLFGIAIDAYVLQSMQRFK
jgi:hypothetical protein